jgi:two-component system, cell cycle sensor histidine kinase and response regulator CckA
MTQPMLAQSAPLEQSPGPTPALRFRRALVADDDGESVAWLADVLLGLGATVVTASSGAELVCELARHGPFDLVVTDIGMPWAEGTAVVRAARASAFRAPVIFISGLTRPGLAAAVASLGNARLLIKPVGAVALRAAIQELLTPSPSS